MPKLQHSEVKPCRCDCGYTCDRTCKLPLLECMEKHYKRDCDHEFSGWEEGATIGGGWMGTAVCIHCGMTALGHDMVCGP